ncbi:MAG: sel1 repeat family protein, partial [Kiritimatiellae bacterium]|nr:sel1 repeat family protein [Kiritimatiellia bacterium]
MKRTLPLLALAALLAGGCALFAPRAESFGSLLARAEAGDAEAQFKVGNCYLHGNGVERNDALAAEWYLKSAEQGYARGEYKLGVSFLRGDGVETNLVAAFEWMKKSADHDYPLAWFALGTFYEEGTGVEKDGAEALRWYRKAAESDHGQARAFAQNSVGRCYRFGIGIERNEQEALVWYLKSAEAGNPAAMENLAQFYTTGAGGTRDLETARSWREKARAVSPDDPVYGPSVRDLLDGDRELEELRKRDTLTPDEQFEVGGALVGGARNVFDPDEGFRLLRQAAEGGNVNAQSYLVHIYYKGLCGVEKNPAEARRFLRMLAGDDVETQAGLGKAFYTGWWGLEQDFRESAYWFLKAIENGYEGPEPKRALERIEWMAPRDYAEARIDLFAERETPDAVPPRPEGATEDAVRALAAARPESLAERVRAALRRRRYAAFVLGGGVSLN